MRMLEAETAPRARAPLPATWREMTPAQRAGVYERAAEAIERRGHAKGTLVDERGRVCLVGAVAVAMDGRFSRQTQRDVLGDAFVAAGDLHKFIFGRGKFSIDEQTRVVNWNNARDTTPEQVCDLLRRGAAALREKECGR